MYSNFGQRLTVVIELLGYQMCNLTKPLYLFLFNNYFKGWLNEMMDLKDIVS
jgi:hypothetical protein